MKTETKLALVRGVIQKFHVQDMLLTARRALEGTLDRAGGRPDRDIDRWSDQAEVAFYEDVTCRRA